MRTSLFVLFSLFILVMSVTMPISAVEKAGHIEGTYQSNVSGSIDLEFEIEGNEFYILFDNSGYLGNEVIFEVSVEIQYIVFGVMPEYVSRSLIISQDNFAVLPLEARFGQSHETYQVHLEVELDGFEVSMMVFDNKDLVDQIIPIFEDNVEDNILAEAIDHILETERETVIFLSAFMMLILTFIVVFTGHYFIKKILK